MDVDTFFDQQPLYEDLRLEDRYAIANKMFLENSGWRYPFDPNKCGRYIEAGNQLLVMASQITSGAGARGQGGTTTIHDKASLQKALSYAMQKLDEYESALSVSLVEPLSGQARRRR